jgi:hypothetical protein
VLRQSPSSVKISVTVNLSAVVMAALGDWIDSFLRARIYLEQCANRAPPTRGKGNIPPVFVQRLGYFLSAWYQRDTGKYERRSDDPVESFTLSPVF